MAQTLNEGDSRHPLDPADTDWGREVERRHRENIDRLGQLDSSVRHVDTKIELMDRHFLEKWAVVDKHVDDDIKMHRSIEVSIGRLDERMGVAERRVDGVQKDLTSIKTDTETLVHLSRAAAAFRKFLIWALPLAAAAATVLTAILLWKGHP